jgi:hypothetical protein
LHVLESPSEVRRGLIYVLRNSVRHGALPAGPYLDTYSSAAFFDDWSEKIRLRILVLDDGPPAIMTATTWLLAKGWRRAGPISIYDAPAG